VVWGALFLLAMTGIIASFVRTAPLAVVGGAVLLALLLLARRGAARRRGAYAIVVVAAVLVGGYAATQLAGDASPVTKYRAESLADPFSDYSVTSRFDRWGTTLEKVADRPWGTGLGTVGRATLRGHRAVFTDNSYLKVLREQGVLGGLLFIGGLAGLSAAVAVGLVRRDPLRRPVGTAALVAFSGFLVLMTMGEYIEQPGKVIAWTLLGVALWEAYGDGDAAVASAG
jgi:O-antigen ligase